MRTSAAAERRQQHSSTAAQQAAAVAAAAGRQQQGIDSRARTSTEAAAERQGTWELGDYGKEEKVSKSAAYSLTELGRSWRRRPRSWRRRRRAGNATCRQGISERGRLRQLLCDRSCVSSWSAQAIVDVDRVCFFPLPVVANYSHGAAASSTSKPAANSSTAAATATATVA